MSAEFQQELARLRRVKELEEKFMAAGAEPSGQNSPSSDPRHPVWAGPPGATTTEQGANPLSNVRRAMGQTARYGAEGIADLLGIVADPLAATANMGMDAVGSSRPRFPRLRDTVSGVADKMGLPGPQGDTEKVIAEASRGAVGAFTGAGIARQIGKNVVAPLGRKAVAMFAEKPILQAAGGASASAAGEKTRQGGGGPVEQFVASLVAGMSPAAAAGTLQALRAVLGGNELGGRAANVRQAVDKFQRETGKSREELASWLDDALAQPEILPGSQPTTAQAMGRVRPDETNTNALFAMERKLAANDPALAGMLDARDVKRNQVRRDAFDAMAPEGNPQAVADSVQARVARLQALAQAKQQAATGKAQARLASAGRPIEDAVAGDSIERVHDDAYGAFKGEVSKAYQDPALTSPDRFMKLPAKAVQRAMKDLFNSRANMADPELVKITDNILSAAQEKGAVPFELYNKFRSDLSKNAQAARIAQNYTGEREANTILEKLDKLVVMNSNHPSAQRMTPDVQQEVNDAVTRAKALRTEQGQKFETGPMRALNQVGGDKAPKLQGAEIPSKFFHSGKSAREDAQRYITSYGQYPEARETMQRYITQKLRDEATDANGVIDPAKLRAWRNNHKDALTEYDALLSPLPRRGEPKGDPNRLGRRFENIADAQEAADSIGGRMVRSQKEIDKSAAGLLLKMDVDDAIAKAMNSTSKEVDLRRLKHLVGPRGEAGRAAGRKVTWSSEKAQDANAQSADIALRDSAELGLKRGMLDFLQKESTSYVKKTPGQDGLTLTQSGLTKAFEKHKDKLKQVFDKPGEMENIARIVKDTEQGAHSFNAGRRGGSDTVAKLDSVSIAKAVMNHKVLTGLAGVTGVSAVTGGAYTAGLVGASIVKGIADVLADKSAVQVQAILRDMMLDPATARLMTQKATESELKRFLPRLQKAVNRYAAGATTELASDVSGEIWSEDDVGR